MCETWVRGHELVAPGRVADTRQAGRERDAPPVGDGDASRLEGTADGQLHLRPGGCDALLQGGRAGLALPDHRPVAGREHRSRRRTATIHPDQKLDHDRLGPLSVVRGASWAPIDETSL